MSDSPDLVDRFGEDRRRLYEAVVNGARGDRPRFEPLVDAAGRLAMPFRAMMLSPRIGTGVQALGSLLRFESQLPDRMREIVTLAVAVHTGCEHEWRSHEFLGRDAGLDDAQLDSIREQRTPPGLDAAETLAYEFACDLLDGVGERSARRAFDGLGGETVFDLVTVVGYYRLLADYLQTFDL